MGAWAALCDFARPGTGLVRLLSLLLALQGYVLLAQDARGPAHVHFAGGHADVQRHQHAHAAGAVLLTDDAAASLLPGKGKPLSVPDALLAGAVPQGTRASTTPATAHRGEAAQFVPPTPEPPPTALL